MGQRCAVMMTALALIAPCADQSGLHAADADPTATSATTALSAAATTAGPVEATTTASGAAHAPEAPLPDLPPVLDAAGSAATARAALTTDGRGERVMHPDAPAYRIAAMIHPLAGTVTGTMQIDTVADAPWDRVELRLRPRTGLFDDASLIVTAARIVTRSDSATAGALAVQMAPTGDACVLPLLPALPAQAHLTLAIDWKMTLSKSGGTGGLDAVSPGGCVLYHWYPELALRGDGAWLPSGIPTLPPAAPLAATAFAVAAPDGWDLVGAGVGPDADTTAPATAATDSAADGLSVQTHGGVREYRWQAPLCRHAALVLGRFHRAGQVVGSGESAVAIVSSYWSANTSADSANGARRALTAAAAAMVHDAALVNPYPRKHLDLVEADVDEPGFCADNLILLPARSYPAPLRPSQAAKDLPDDLVTFTTLHLAHEWWTNQIASDQAKDPWLAEALSGWCALDCLAHDVDAPTAATVLEDRLAEFRENVQDHDLPLDDDLAHYPGDLRPALLDKGTLVLVALQQQIGDARFRAFIADLAHYLDQSLSDDRFRAALARAIGVPDATAFYAKWIHDGALDMSAYTAITTAYRAASHPPASAIPAATAAAPTPSP